MAAVLELASVAAHSSERRAAPIACWLAALAGRDPAEARALAETLSEAAASARASASGSLMPVRARRVRLDRRDTQLGAARRAPRASRVRPARSTGSADGS